MKNWSVDRVIQAWVAHGRLDMDGAAESPATGLQLMRSALQLLLEGRPVSATALAQHAGLPRRQVEAILTRYRARGGEFDAQGNLVGAALTLRTTPHRLRIREREFFAWCALDSLFLPGLIDESAEVTSTCPASGALIRLQVSPVEVTDSSPASAVLSITIPGLSCSPEETGPESATCSQIHFFRARADAERWLEGRPGIAILTVAEASQLADENWIKPARRLTHETGRNDTESIKGV